MLSGTLPAYSWFRRWQQPGPLTGESIFDELSASIQFPLTEPQPCWTSWAYWLRFYRHRVVRLWPAYIYTLVAVTTRVSITHYHPMWPPPDPAVQCPKVGAFPVSTIHGICSIGGRMCFSSIPSPTIAACHGHGKTPHMMPIHCSR